MPSRDEMKRFYEENGYLVVENLLTDADLAGVRRRTEEMVADPGAAAAGVSIGREGDTVADKSRPEAANATVRGIAFPARFDPVFREVARHPRLLELVRSLIGPRIMLFRDQMLLKPPGGQEKPLHQDQSYFRVQPEDAIVTAWIALDPATVENGCMEYVPGSHRHGLFSIVPDPERPVHHVPQTGDLALPPPVACPVPAGSVIFHHGCTLHRSGVNRTNTWRRALILHYATADARSEHPRLNEEVSLRID
jgi:ectoine hydroxylase-related dioxygenase (phytanoyl-CoA dioxygenase family)